MTGALVKRTVEKTMQKTESPVFTRWERFKTACSAINHFQNPRKAVATEGLQRGTGTLEQRQEWREYLVRKGNFEAIGTDAPKEMVEAPYRKLPPEVIDNARQIEILAVIARKGIERRTTLRENIAIVVTYSGIIAGALAVITGVAAIGTMASFAGFIAWAGVGIVTGFKQIQRTKISHERELAQLQTSEANARRLLSE